MAIDNAAARYLLDTYLDWARAEGPPVHEGAVVNASTMELAPWPRRGEGVRAGFALVAGRGDFLALHVIELAAGAATRLARHVFDEVFLALSGSGVVRVGGVRTDGGCGGGGGQRGDERAAGVKT